MEHVPVDADVARELIGAYFQRYGPVRHQIEAFDNFVSIQLPHIIQESAELRVRDQTEDHHIACANVSLTHPLYTEVDGTEHPLLPHMARLRGLTYEVHVVVDVVHDIRVQEAHVERRVFREVHLCSLPCMVGSRVCCYTQQTVCEDECRLDQGGYFIVNGVEKCLIAQERLRTNVPFVFALKGHARFALQCEIRSCHERKLRSTSTLYLYLTAPKRGAVPEMLAELPFVTARIPLFALFRVLGVPSRERVVDLVLGRADRLGEEWLTLWSILEGDATAEMGDEELHEWIGREATTETTKERRGRYLDHILSNELLPHMGLENTPPVHARKAAFLGMMVRKLLRVHLGRLAPDDRDHYCNKRLDPSGMGLLFRQMLRATMKTLASQLYRLREQGKLRYTNVADVMSSRRITSAFRQAFATGNWGIQQAKSSVAQTGVVQQISRMTLVSTLSNMRRINTPISREGKAPKPRQLHHTAWGVVCPVETPEGSACGLVKSLALLAHVRIGVSSEHVVAQIEAACAPLDFEPIDAVTPDGIATGVPVLANGILVGHLRDPDEGDALLAELRALRRSGCVPFDTTLASGEGCVQVDTDAGCLLRPLLVGERMHLLPDLVRRCAHADLLWEEALRANVIEYVDKQEEEGLCVGLRCDAPDAERHTHYELHPSVILGLCAGLIPFSDHNQAPRNTYQSAMCKQAVGVYALNHNLRMDTVAHVLFSPQRALVCTQLELMLAAAEAPAGVNLVVAIATCDGYNQEDSVIVNESAIQRGLLRSVKYVTTRDEERPIGAEGQKLERPDPQSCTGVRVGNYDKLPETGVLPVGSRVEAGDVVIGKTVSTVSAEDAVKGSRRTTKRDRSTLQKHDACVVDAVLTSVRGDGCKTIKVKTRSTRVPTVGDKFCLTPEHEVLTPDGWARIDAVREGNAVLCLDATTGRADFEPVAGTVCFPLGEADVLVHVRNERIDLVATPEHLVPLADERGVLAVFTAAEVAAGRVDGGVPTCFRGGVASFADLPSPVPPHLLHAREEWMYVVGACYRCGMPRGDGVCVSAPPEDLLHCLARLGAPADADREAGTVFFLAGTDLEAAREASLARPHLPGWALRLPADQSRCLLHGVLLDPLFGSRPRGDRRLIGWPLSACEDLLRLALHAGLAASLRPVRDDEAVVVLHETDRVAVDPATDVRLLPRGGGHARVHCLTVRTGLFFVRRHGRPCWTGNSSRMGQKGVIGRTFRQEDMPYTAEGVVPDLILNPHAIPSRMTIGQLLECLLGKLASRRCQVADATPFSGANIDEIGDELEREGMDRMGNEVMYSPKTGEAFEAAVFLGPVFYQRLKHMVADKNHARSRGPVQVLTRQPLEGRAKEGGLRFGEMERDCVISHGCADFLRERLLLVSDAFTVFLCSRCGNLAIPPRDEGVVVKRSARCRVCEDGSSVVQMQVPYAFKLLVQELAGMHVGIQLLTD